MPLKNGNMAVFKKLKINGTSTQIGGHPFQLRFQVMREVQVGHTLRYVPLAGMVWTP